MEDVLENPGILSADDLFDGPPAAVAGELRTAAGVLKSVPPIAAPAPAASTAVATKQGAEIDLTKIDLQEVALAQFKGARTAIALATATLTNVVHDLSTASKLADAKSLRERLINAPLADARKVSKNLKSKLNTVSKAVGAELESIEADFGAADALITPQISKREAELEAERVEKARLEQVAQDENAARCANLLATIDKAQGKTAEQIGNAIAHIEKLVIAKEKWGGRDDFVKAGESAKATLLDSLRKLQADTKTAEQMAAMRAENERLAAELARKEAEAAAAREAEESARRAEEAARAEAQAAKDAEDKKAAEVERLLQEVVATPPAPVVAAPPEPDPVPPAPPAVGVVGTGGTGSWRPTFRAPQPAVEPTPAPTPTPIAAAVAATDGAIAAAESLLNDLGSDAGEAPVLAIDRLLAHIRKAFEKFPSNPKVTPEWWADLRRLADEVEA